MTSVIKIVCRACGASKPSNEFAPSQIEKYFKGHRYLKCRQCLTSEGRARYYKNREAYLQRRREKLRASPENRARYLWKSISSRAGKEKGYENRPLLCTREDFMRWLLNNAQYHLLFEEWKKAGCPLKLSPSIDRIDNEKGYALENMQVLTMGANSRKGVYDNFKSKNHDEKHRWWRAIAEHAQQHGYIAATKKFKCCQYTVWKARRFAGLTRARYQ